MTGIGVLTQTPAQLVVLGSLLLTNGICSQVGLTWGPAENMLFVERKHAPWFWLGWVPRGPAGSLRFARAHSELHSGEVSIHPLKNRVTKRKPQRRLSEAVGEKTIPSIITAAEARGFLKDQLDSTTVPLLSAAAPCSRCGLLREAAGPSPAGHREPPTLA